MFIYRQNRSALISFFALIFAFHFSSVQAIAGEKQNSPAASTATGLDAATVKMLKDANIPLPPKSYVKDIVITGEVIDMWCYISQTMGSGKGKGHQQCALLCLAGGVPIGILEDKTHKVYLAARSMEPYQGCQKVLARYAGKRVRVHGLVASREGYNVLKVAKVEPLE